MTVLGFRSWLITHRFLQVRCSAPSPGFVTVWLWHHTGYKRAHVRRASATKTVGIEQGPKLRAAKKQSLLYIITCLNPDCLSSRGSNLCKGQNPKHHIQTAGPNHMVSNFSPYMSLSYDLPRHPMLHMKAPAGCCLRTLLDSSGLRADAEAGTFGGQGAPLPSPETEHCCHA